ncbi:transmembrane protein 134 isoform X1 [Myotis yumanensis]|uniref:transmembrane protein 134 isoform X1 n=1 Tax=Myotis yumanensis TaxID=159337 RepID=UPI0038D45A72
MSAARPQFSIDDAFELSLEDAGPGPESSGVARFGPLHFERRARFEAADEDKQSRLRYQNLENDEEGAQVSPEPDGGVNTRDSGRTSSVRSSQWSFSTISNSTQRSYNACCSWTQHPLIQKNRKGFPIPRAPKMFVERPHQGADQSLSLQTFPKACQGPCSENSLASCPGTFSSGGGTPFLGPQPCWGLRLEVPAPAPVPALTLAAPSVCSADPGRRGTGGGPLTRCLQRHLLRARLPVAGPGSLPRDLHLLRGQGPPGFPVLLPALL